jgi:transcriptional regulator with XRE-family HTH domain
VPPESATVAGWELALRLRERRMELGMEVKTITDRLGFTRNYWSAVENERKILSAEKLAQLLDLLEYDKDERDELLGLRESARLRGWWAGYSALFSYEILRYIGLEHGA